MEKILKLYTYVDGTNDTPFPSTGEQVVIGSFTYTANRMGGSPTISATVKHSLCLDDLWNDKVYAEFNGEKYFVINTPSSSKSNDDTRYEHDLELISEREILNHVYFIDAVQGDSDVDVYKSNSTKVLFYGDIEQFVSRLNASLSYRNLEYTAVIDDGITSDDKQVSFEDKYILEALQEEFNIFEIPYYFVGKVIHFGYTSNAITTTFKYGHDDAFLSISKDNANYALINRITGIGSSDNIPYYYPNETDDQSAVEASGKKWITPSQNLMPSIYRESEGAEMFYEAKNNTYPDGEGGYYQFENEYSDANPREGKTDFEDIKPTITGITNAAGQRIDMFVEFAYDTNDNDEVDEEGNYLHPYFFAKLRKTDGTYGFNLFDHAIESQTMQITLTSGICGACTFEIGVGESSSQNTVQVDDTGNLLRDEEGDVRCGREGKPAETPQERQNDTQNYEVWIALRKDYTTYPQVMPNVNYNYKPSTSDTFAILGISLPQAYILKAEDELEKSLVKHMWMNNVEKFTFSSKFSRIFFTEHPEVLAQLNENARVLIEYNGKQHTLYIDNYSYKMDASSPLPEIDVDFVDTLTIGKNSLQTQLDSVKQDILSSIGGGDFLKQGLKYFLRKDQPDTDPYPIKFLAGIVTDRITSLQYSLGALGSGLFVGLDENGDSYIEADRMLIRKVATFVQLLIQELKHVGGQIVLSPASMRCSRVEEYDTYYRCYFETTDGDRTINQEFVAGDQARCQTFNIKEGVNENVTNQYYWRLVTATGDNYIDLSKADCDAGSTAPRAGDDIVQLGNRTDATRQGAIVLSAYGTDSPSIKLYKGISSYQLTGKERLSLSPQQVRIIADSLTFTTGEDVKEQLSAAGSNIAALQTRMSAAELKITPDAIVSTVSGTIATAKQEAISAAASDATTKANNALASAKSDAAAKYATITTVNTMSTQISQLSNQISLKANSSTVTTLQNNLNAANSNITALQQRMSAAEVKITPDAIVSTVVGSGQVPYKKQVIIDATGLAEKWWLVTIGRISEYVPTIITVNSPLQASYGKPSWATHASGFSVTLRWSTNGYGWGISGSVERVVHEFAYGWCSGSITPVGSIGQMTYSSYEYVYVRGGGKYIFYVESSFSDIRNVSVTLHTTNYTLQGQTITSPVTSVTVPVVDLKTKQTAEQIKSQLVQTPEGFKFYGKVVDIKASILTAQNIAALNISTGNLTVTTGAKIGGWQVSGNSLACTGQASAQLNVNISGTRFLRINNSSTLLSIRADGITGESITVYGEGSKGLYVLCNASGSGTAIESFGNCSFTARQNEEITFSGLVQMGGLRLAYKRVNTTYTCNWQDCFIHSYTGSHTVYLPASPHVGRVIYVLKTSSSSYKLIIDGNGNKILRKGSQISSFSVTTSGDIMKFVYCNGFWAYNFTKSGGY